MRSAVGIALERDGRNGNGRERSELLFETVILRFALGEAEAPAVIVDRDVDMVGVFECLGTLIEGGIVEIPLGRGKLPDQPGELLVVLLVAGIPTLGGEVELVPPGKLSLR
ncbi:hypothetical protein D9M70_406620 [compost metagenome]